MENKYQRCYTRNAIFNCPSCDKIHNFCQNCDEYIHSLNNNKYHKRNILNISNENPNYDYLINKSENNNMRNNSQFNLNISHNNNGQYYTFPLNNTSFSNNFSSKEELEKENEKNTPSFYKFQTYYNSSKKNDSHSINNRNLTSSNKNNIKKVNNVNNKYSCIKSIKNQIEYVKKNMYNKIDKILLSIDNNDENINYKEKLNEIEKNYQEQINNLMEIKNKEINKLENEIKEANKTNETLMNEISKANDDNNIKVIELTNIINLLTDELNQKEEQILILKGNSEKNEALIQNEIDEEKDNICSEYEQKINNILNISEHNQQKLMNVIKEKDVIIQNLIKCNQDKNDKFNEFVEKISDDNQKLRDITQESIGMAKYNLVNSMNNNYYNMEHNS